MANVTVIVAPAYLEAITGVAAVKISERYFYACDKELKTLFSCKRKRTDVSQDFMALVQLIAARALEEVQSVIGTVDAINKALDKKV
jgi:hypothetical protein